MLCKMKLVCMKISSSSFLWLRIFFQTKDRGEMLCLYVYIYVYRSYLMFPTKDYRTVYKIENKTYPLM